MNPSNELIKMKKIILFITFCIFISKNYSQGIDVLSAEQFCSGTSQLLFPNVYGGTSTTPVGCLGSTPNAAYFFMQIDNPGNLIFTISQENTAGTPIDVDFIAWGPFIDINDANANISFTDCPTCPNNTTNPTFYPYAPDQITDCSFDIAPTETMSITNALQGQIYVVLITNYNGTQGNITFQQTGGTGTTTCENSPICGSNFYDTGGIGGNYNNNETETTTIYPYFAGGTVTVDFTTFNVNTGDILTVYNGPNASFPVLGTVTGAPSSFSSTNALNPSGALTFVFTSNASGVASGWASDISCTPPPTCGLTFYDSGGAGGNYSNNEFQTTTFFPDTAGDAVTVTFTLFDLEFADDLYIYNGPDAASPLLGVFNGTTIPGPFTSTHATGALTFVFDSDFSVTHAGWEASISCAPYVPPAVCGTTFYDSGGATGNYFNNQNQTTTLVPDIAGTTITATFTAFDIESCCDSLTIYDGPNTGSPLLGTFTGNTLPPTFTSSDPTGALTFVFTSDDSITRLGWAADITCAPISPTCGDTFYDSGGGAGNYGNNENETTVIAPINIGDAVTVTFSDFNTQANNDVLLVYNGPDATAPLLATLSGNLTTALPGPYTSTDPSGSLTFVFTSDGSVRESGWTADVTCNILCNMSITQTLDPIGADNCTLNYSQLLASSSGNPGGTATIFSENFNGASFPAGWNIVNGAASAQWIISNSNNAGGTTNEAMLDWTTGSNITSWSLSSPAIPITGYTNLQLSFKQDLWQFGTDFTIFLETSSNGATWTPRYTYANPPDLTETRNVDISAEDGNNTLYFRFRFTGDSFDLFSWSIDDIIITGDSPPIAPQITWLPIAGLYTDPGLTTAYISGSFTDTVYAAPNGTVTYTATDQNGCTADVTVTRNRKVWRGTVNTDWYTPANWSGNAIPTSSDCVIIPDLNTTNNNSPIVIGGPPTPPPPGLARSLRVLSNGYLELTSESNLIVTDNIYIEDAIAPYGKIVIRDDGNLIQINNSPPNNNVGNIQMQRNVNSLTNLNYVYWSSPVNGFNVTNVSPGTNNNLIWHWIPTVASNGIGHYGTWQNTTEVMLPGKGYIVRCISGTSPETTPALNTVEFTGIARNGIISHNITHGNYSGGDYPGAGNTMATELDDNWNLVGNPYPSSISATKFITQNASIISTDNPNPAITGTIYLWNHLNLPSNLVNDPFYGDYVYNYNPNNYIAFNNTGANPPGFNGNIASGQAFFVLMDHNASTTGSSVVFNNNMRYDDTDPLNPSPYANNEFFRVMQRPKPHANRNTIERHRIWLDLIAPNNHANSILVGYVENATNGIDRLFDGFDLSKTSIRFYSLINEDKMSIQGRSLPFDVSDTVPLGLVIPENGNYTIAINSIDGLFSNTNQDIFLEDTYLNIIHDLRNTPYSFNSNIGTFNNRFILRYTNNALNITEETLLNGLLISAPNNSYIKVTSELEQIKTISVFDVLGRILYQDMSVNQKELIINNPSFSNGTYIVRASLSNGLQKTQKIILK